MYCDDCGSAVAFDLQEYVERKEELGTVLCCSCRNRGTTGDASAVSAATAFY